PQLRGQNRRQCLVLGTEPRRAGRRYLHRQEHAGSSAALTAIPPSAPEAPMAAPPTSCSRVGRTTPPAATRGRRYGPGGQEVKCQFARRQEVRQNLIRQPQRSPACAGPPLERRPAGKRTVDKRTCACARLWDCLRKSSTIVDPHFLRWAST